MNITNKWDGKTALLRAVAGLICQTPLGLQYASLNHMACVRALLDAGAAVNRTTLEGHSALLLVVVNGHVECARALIDAGANVNQPIDDSTTLLSLATRKGRVEIVRALIEGGAELNHRDAVSKMGDIVHQMKRLISNSRYVCSAFPYRKVAQPLFGR